MKSTAFDYEFEICLFPAGGCLPLTGRVRASDKSEATWKSRVLINGFITKHKVIAEFGALSVRRAAQKKVA